MAEKECIDYRVDAVEDYAKAHYEESGWDYVVETMTRWAIYDLVKWQRSGEGAIKKVAGVVGAKHEYRAEIQALAGESKRGRTSDQIAQTLERVEGPQTDKNICAHCFTEVRSLEDLNNHDCKGILEGTVNTDAKIDLSNLADKPEVTDAEVDAAIEEIEINLTDYVEPTDEQKAEVNAEYLEAADAQELNLDAPNGYFKNGNPKPVSKKDRERLLEEARKGNGGQEPQH